MVKASRGTCWTSCCAAPYMLIQSSELSFVLCFKWNFLSIAFTFPRQDMHKHTDYRVSPAFLCFSYVCFHSVLLDPSFPKVSYHPVAGSATLWIIVGLCDNENCRILLQKRAPNSGKLVASDKSDMTQSVVCKITTTMTPHSCAS